MRLGRVRHHDDLAVDQFVVARFGRLVGDRVEFGDRHLTQSLRRPRHRRLARRDPSIGSAGARTLARMRGPARSGLVDRKDLDVGRIR